MTIYPCVLDTDYNIIFVSMRIHVTMNHDVVKSQINSIRKCKLSANVRLIVMSENICRCWN